MSLLRNLLPPIIIALLLSLIFVVPKDVNLLPSAAKPELPLGTELDGWSGVKTQESEKERLLLADDTVFSKGLYNHINPFTYAKEEPSISVSIVYSGSDLNNSIHRPERCLPSQGHVNLICQDSDIPLDDGRTLTFRKINSQLPIDKNPKNSLRYIHYYVFVSNNFVTNSHLTRTLRDIYDRIVTGRVQRWAYIQIGTHWGGSTDITEEQADSLLRALISKLVSRQIDWQSIEN